MGAFPSDASYFWCQSRAVVPPPVPYIWHQKEDFISAPMTIVFSFNAFYFGAKVRVSRCWSSSAHSLRMYFWPSEIGFNSCTNHGRVSLRCVLFLVPKSGGCSSARSLYISDIRKRISYLHQWRSCFPLMRLILAPKLSGCSSARSLFLTIRKRI